ncbi:O-antigen ligase family protein [Candidatus Magnetobacterium casense]|uniref:O-antigen ligase family protein n=1 Tax=Candidatus Magnetobacterium casense TaxID=1455061 RepID=A0ABS6S392_9BACT|nr:O-antigen ligase family protein [Candidatus Magnetobacterium casensis]MBV6343306.1 O-antigen ligase family protein [Candidatus Magnetobacterium casensis]
MALTTVFAALMALLAGMIYMLSPLYLVGAVCVLTLAFVALKGPMWGLLLTTFVYNIENTALHVHIADGNDHVDYPVYIVFLLVTLAGWAVHKAFNYHLKRQPTPLDLPLLALFLYQGVSLLWTPSLVLGLHFFLLLCFNMLMFYLLTAIIKTTRQLELVIAFMAVSALIHAVSVFISQWYTPHAELRFDKNIVLSYFALWQMDSRPWGLGGGPTMSGFVVAVIIFMLAFMVNSTGKKRISVVMVTILLSYSIVLMGVRAAFIALLPAFFLFFRLHPASREMFFRYAAMCIATMLLIVITATPGFIDRMLVGFGYRGEPIFTKKSSQHDANTAKLSSQKEGVTGMKIRKQMWLDGLRYIQEHPLTFVTGMGIGGLVHVSPNTPREIHSLLLAFFFDMGVAGILLLIYICYVLFENMYGRLHRLDTGQLSGLFAASCVMLLAVFGIEGLVWFDINSPSSRYVWFLLGLHVAIVGIKEEA